MKTTFLLLAIWLVPGYVCSQFRVGTMGITIKKSSTLSVNGLTLVPSSDLTISSNSLTKSAVPVPGSIARVYQFSSPIVFSGVARIAYLESELNGLPENNLQIAHSSDAVAYSITAGSVMSAPANFVYNTVSNRRLLTITIMRRNNARTGAPAVLQTEDPSGEFLLLGNPVRDEAILSYQAWDSGKAIIRLLDVNGQVLLTREENIAAGANRFSLMMNRWKSGIYLVELSTSHERKTLKLLKE
jgi:hypothetical protein